MAPRGRKNKYTTHVEPYLKKIQMWRTRNVEIEEICKRLNVTRSSFYKYKAEHPELAEVLNDSFEDVQAFAENKLYELMNADDKRIALDATKFFLTHRSRWMTEAQKQNIEINKEKAKKLVEENKKQTTIIKKVFGDEPDE